MRYLTLMTGAAAHMPACHMRARQPGKPMRPIRVAEYMLEGLQGNNGQQQQEGRHLERRQTCMHAYAADAHAARPCRLLVVRTETRMHVDNHSVGC